MVNIVNAFLHGLEKPSILWLLSQRPRHGYEIIKEFRRLTGQKLKPSTMYLFLHALEKRGFIVSNWIEKDRRKIRCYRLTKKGESLLEGFRNFFDMPIREFIVDMSFEKGEIREP